jgi:hypothetical protein
VPEEFGTVSVRRGDRARELEALRQRYRQHRESLMLLVSDAPTEHLATEYQRLVRDIDVALAKIGELEGRSGTAPGVAGAAAATASSTKTVPPRESMPVTLSQGDLLHSETEPGNRTLIPPPGAAQAYEMPPSASSRMALIAVAAIIVIALIGFLIWRASSDRGGPQPAAVAPLMESAPVTAPVTSAPPPPPPPPPALVITPAVVDFGTVGKGTRAARQLEITNNTAETIPIRVSRSQCRCLFYEYADKVAPKKKETVTVTVDGARAKAGTLDETITVSTKKAPAVSTTFQVTGTVK